MRAAKISGKVSGVAKKPFASREIYPTAAAGRERHRFARPACFASAFSEYLTWIKAKIASSPI
jgi:hypothetical protein